MRTQNVRVPHPLASAAAMGLIALALAGCQTTDSGITGSLGPASAPRETTPRTKADWRQELAVWGPRYRAHPGDPQAAIAYARALRANGQRAQAVAVLQEATIRNPKDMKLLGAYGRALADAGQYTEALDALGRAHTPDNPDWRILNAQGAVLDEMGRHPEAQRHYAAALYIVPNEPSVLSNLGMSEATLRKAVAQPGAKPKVMENLALVVGLQGRFVEAEKIASADLPASEAEGNVAYLRQMSARQHSR
jgi:Flp pilus assembly protein TadD